MLVVVAERTRGTRQHSLWGFDSTTGEREWEYLPEAKELEMVGSHVVPTDGIWSLGYVEGSVVIVEAFSDPDSLVLTALRPVDGSVTSQGTVDLGGDGSSYWLQVLGWEGESLYLDMGGRLKMINWLTADEIASWP